MTRWALAGAGWMSAVHGLAVRALGGEVVAVASRTEAAAARRAAETGGVVVSYDDLPAGADVVIVATPPSRHAADALRAMAAGSAVVVEKPLCTTLADADRLVRVVDAGGVLTYAENLLFADAVSTALTEIATIGELQHLTARSLQPRPTWGDFTTRAWGGGVLFDLGVHPLALVLRAAGSARPTSVRARFDTSPDIEVEDHARVALRFDTGLVAELEVSWRDDAPVWDLQAASATGVVRLGLVPEVFLERDGEPRPLPPRPDRGDDGPPPQLDDLGYVEQLRDAEAAWRAGRSSSISDVHLGRDLLEVVCAASVAARTGDEVALPFDGPRHRTPVELWRPDPGDGALGG